MSFPLISRWRTCLFQLPRFSGGPGEITLAGAIADSEGTGIPRMRVFGQWALVFLVSGKGFYKDERGAARKMEAGNWILVFPEMAHSYGPSPGEHWNEIYVCFRGPVFEAWREAGCFDPSRPTGSWLPPAKGVRAFENFFRRLQRNDCSSLQAVCHWQELLSDIVGLPPEPTKKGGSWLEKALDILEHSKSRSGTEPLRSAALACGLGYESFRKKFESAVGMPPGRYVMARRIERARKLLALQSLTNSEISGMLGFHDEFHFSKTFSRLTGLSPREFRKQVRQG